MARLMLTRCLHLFSDLNGFGSDHMFVEGWAVPDRDEAS